VAPRFHQHTTDRLGNDPGRRGVHVQLGEDERHLEATNPGQLPHRLSQPPLSTREAAVQVLPARAVGHPSLEAARTPERRSY